MSLFKHGSGKCFFSGILYLFLEGMNSLQVSARAASFASPQLSFVTAVNQLRLDWPTGTSFYA
jgi:hypothetical protein